MMVALYTRRRGGGIVRMFRKVGGDERWLIPYNEWEHLMGEEDLSVEESDFIMDWLEN